ncbi:RNA polymerase sigma factor [Sporosarcina sp. FA9]|uniref:RNA polymerase sigma factor n=1 Tax=Sporosarcina sp. FA9 TaxID=3413030 RepID=UPI003F659F2B
MKSVKALVKKAKRGDGDAFVLLVKQYEDVLYRTANRMLNNDEDVADALQDTIMSAYEKLHTLRKDEYFNTWIYKILLNKCNSLLNKRKSYSTFDVHVLPEQTNGDFQNIELEDALNSLNPDYKTAFSLYYIAGLNTKEISTFLKEPEGTIKSRLSRGKLLLRNNYYKSEGEILNEN